MERCNASHAPAYLNLVHPQYDEEELQANSDIVKVGWEYEALDTGGFIRKGGDHITLAQWVLRLRTDWNIPEPSERSRAQK